MSRASRYRCLTSRVPRHVHGASKFFFFSFLPFLPFFFLFFFFFSFSNNSRLELEFSAPARETVTEQRRSFATSGRKEENAASLREIDRLKKKKKIKKRRERKKFAGALFDKFVCRTFFR